MLIRDLSMAVIIGIFWLLPCLAAQDEKSESEEEHYISINGDQVEILGTLRGRHITGPHVRIDDREVWRLSLRTWYRAQGLGTRESVSDPSNQNQLDRVRIIMQALERQNVIVRGTRIDNERGGRQDDPTLEVESIIPSPQTQLRLQDRLEELNRESEAIRHLINSSNDQNLKR